MRSLLIHASLAVLLAAPQAAAQRDTAFTWSKKLGDGARLSIVNLNGPIDVRAASGDRVEVHASVHAEFRGNVNDVTFDVRERSADDVKICTVFQNRSSCDQESFNNIRVSVRYTVDLPKGMRLDVTTGNGAVSITQTVSEVAATTGNGDVTIKESLGRVTTATGNGDITVTAARGPVRVTTGNGRIVANTTRGPVDASTGSGDIDVRVGSVPADQTTMTYSTGNGSVRVALPADFNGELNASTGNGSITSDFEIRVTGRLTSSRLRGTIGNGNGPTVRVSSGNGRLEIRKY